MRKNRIFKNQEPLKNIDNNPLMSQVSKYSTASHLKSNYNYSIIDNLLLNDLVPTQNNKSSYGQVIRLAYISTNNQIHIDEEALYILQRFSSSQITFVGIYGEKHSGKSFLFDKILNLAGIQGTHVNISNIKFCRTSENYEKGLYFYSIPFQKASNLNIFLLDCVGFEKNQKEDFARAEQMILDLMMVLCSSVIFLTSPEDTKSDIFKHIYDRVLDCTERITENKQQSTKDKDYWPQNIYCLHRTKNKIDKNDQALQKLFTNYNYSVIHDALSADLKNKGFVKDDIMQIQALPQKNLDSISLNGLYIKQISRMTRQIIQKSYNKKYLQLKYNGNIICKLLLNIIKHMNKKQRIKIDKIFKSLLKQLYQSAYQYHIQFYDQKLQEYFIDNYSQNPGQQKTYQSGYPIDYILIAFQNCQRSILQSFNQLTISYDMHQQYQSKLCQYIEQKQSLILQINRKKTKYQLKNKLKNQVSFPSNFKNSNEVHKFTNNLRTIQQQLDHDRCESITLKLLDFTKFINKQYNQDYQSNYNRIMKQYQDKLGNKKKTLQNQKQLYMKNIMINTQNQKIYKNFNSELEGVNFKIKNTKKQIEIQKKYQKQFMATKQASKQHAQHLLAFIRELQQKSRDNQKQMDQINKQFEYNPTIQVLNKRIQQKIRLQKQYQRNQSQISNKQHKRNTQIRTVNSNSNISGVRSGVRLPSSVVK